MLVLIVHHYFFQTKFALYLLQLKLHFYYWVLNPLPHKILEEKQKNKQDLIKSYFYQLMILKQFHKLD